MDFVLETSARLLRLLSVLQGRTEWTGAELASRLGVTGRTLRRDMARLRELGYPIQATPGVAGGYRLGAGSTLPPLLLDDDEAVAIVLSLRGATSVTGVAETSLMALSKLERMLPNRLRQRVSALRQVTVPLANQGAAVDPDALTIIAEACQRQSLLAFTYRGRDGTGERLVEPHRLVHTGRHWYLVAYDQGRADWRTFRADRIDRPHPTGTRFAPRDPPDAAAFVADSVTTAPYRYRARVLIHAPASVVAQQVPPTVGVIEDVAGQSCLLTAGADSLAFMAVHIAMMGHDFTVLEPAELIEEMKVLAQRLGDAYQRSSSPAEAA